MSLLSASNLPRIAVCAPSAFLPREKQPFSKNAEKGTNVHKFVSDCIQLGEPQARAVMPSRFNGKSLVERLQVPAILAGLQDLQTEIAVRWDALKDECSILGTNIGRNYYQFGAKKWDIVGSIDIVARNSDGLLVVADVKTGIQQIDPVSSEQLQALAYICSRLYESPDGIETRIIKINDKGDVSHSFHRVRPAEMELLRLKFQGIREKVLDNHARYAQQQELDYVVSDACRYCQSRKSCPAFAANPIDFSQRYSE